MNGGLIKDKYVNCYHICKPVIFPGEDKDDISFYYAICLTHFDNNETPEKWEFDTDKRLCRTCMKYFVESFNLYGVIDINKIFLSQVKV
jgi:hypothetical protein